MPVLHEPHPNAVAEVADAIGSLPADGINGIRWVGIDGVDAAGKTTFADTLADVLTDRGNDVIRASADGFHHPRAVRYRRGRHPPRASSSTPSTSSSCVPACSIPWRTGTVPRRISTIVADDA